MLIMAIVIVLQIIISMTTTPSLIRVSKPDNEMTMMQSWPIALVQMLLMIVGFLCLSYLVTEPQPIEN
jgi:O-antigen/teichoic acid export membrane protein